MALDSFRRDFSLRGASDYEQDTLEGNIVSTFQAGTFFGALLTFPVAEILGRKKAILAAIITFIAGGSLMVRHLKLGDMDVTVINTLFFALTYSQAQMADSV